VCEQSEGLLVADFVSKNIKSANNMSDEEMEDVISELRKTGIKLYCKQSFVPCNWDNRIIWEKVKKDSLQVFHPYLY
jgi:predicted peroxiredoxin